METEFSIQFNSYVNDDVLRYDRRNSVFCCCKNDTICAQNSTDQQLAICKNNDTYKCSIGLRVCIEICRFNICTSSGRIKNNVNTLNFAQNTSVGELSNPMSYTFTDNVSYKVLVCQLMFTFYRYLLKYLLTYLTMTHIIMKQ